MNTIGLALQGGGSHGAFSWGVLDRLLELDEKNLRFESICGTSAGAVNAVVMTYGMHVGGRIKAKELLEKLWLTIAQQGVFKINYPFIEYFTQKQLLTFYLLGTFFGGILYLLSHNYFPLFEGRSSILIGGSAGISAIFIGITTYIPTYQFKIRFIGFVKLWYLAAIWIGLDILALSGSNAGGHFAHLGGALFGFIYVSRGTTKESNILNIILSVFKTKKRPFRKVYKSPKKSVKKETNTSLTQQQIDVILDKISKSGYDALTQSEKEFLFKLTNELRNTKRREI